jgi:hypothetical protein
MVRSDIAASGVMFSLDTESGFDQVVFVTASYGLGEAVVQGAVNPDEFYVYKRALAEKRPAILRRSLGGKSVRMVYSASHEPGRSITTEPVPHAERKRFCITDSEAEQLGRLAMTIEAHYGRPMDIEWGKDGIDGQLYILQARPETVKAQADIYAASMKTALKPENSDPPLMSDFNPLGDRDHPRPSLPYPFTQNGADMPEHLLTVEEIGLLLQVTPGHYRITKTDDTQVIVSVIPTTDSATGAITRMNLVSKFGNKSSPEDSKNWPPLRVWLAELLGVPAPMRQRTTLPTGRISAPQLGAVGSAHGVITGSLESQMNSLGPIRREVEAMLARDADRMEPSLA